MPAEGGYPAYLASRLSSYYERAGQVTTLGTNSKDASLTLLGAVSPPSGDFSEPVTKTTKRFVRAFWSLDAKLAYSRHYPAISWIDSYSEYDSYIEQWWLKNVGEGWPRYRQRINALLALSDNLQNVVQLIGSENLPVDQQLAIFVATILKQSFLIQNAFDAIDRYCSPLKVLKMAEIMLEFYDRGLETLKSGVPIFKVKEISQIAQIKRIRIDIDDNSLDKIDQIKDAMKEEFQQLVLNFGEAIQKEGR
jgi:V/A-type H+-transporting ATPase subunit A